LTWVCATASRSRSVRGRHGRSFWTGPGPPSSEPPQWRARSAPPPAAREDIRRRFDRRAHAVARAHAHITNVYDFSADTSYLVTEAFIGLATRCGGSSADGAPVRPAGGWRRPRLLPSPKAGPRPRRRSREQRGEGRESDVRHDGVIKLTDFARRHLEQDEKFTSRQNPGFAGAPRGPETIEGKFPPTSAPTSSPSAPSSTGGVRKAALQEAAGRSCCANIPKGRKPRRPALVRPRSA